MGEGRATEGEDGLGPDPASPRNLALPSMQDPPAPPSDLSKRGRITLYCIAETFDRKRLDELLQSTYSPTSIKSFPASGSVRDAAKRGGGWEWGGREEGREWERRKWCREAVSLQPQTLPRLNHSLTPTNLCKPQDCFYVEYLLGSHGNPGADISFCRPLHDALTPVLPLI